MRIFYPKRCFSNMLKVPNPKKLIRRVFPILQWSRTYDARAGVGDLIAGITIALTLVPQSIAYASLAGFEPQALKDIKIKDKAADEKGSRKAKILKRFLWFTGVARNAVVVCLASVTAFILHEDKYDPFLLTGTITAGLPAVRPPAFETTVGNTTYTGGDMLSHLGSGLAVVPIVAILSNVAIAKAFGE
ncbi:hypothetical protein B5X24_HaOG209204 [Helicoverpa armigera]|nr:hypothetical protein B5X24_HaOG209204 [Helicoverpa armigera]